MLIIYRDALNGNNLDDDFHSNPTPGEVVKFKDPNIMSCRVERRISK